MGGLAAVGIDLLGRVLDKVLPDSNARAQAREALQELDKTGELALLMGQLEINRQEAAHGSLFVAGWRPAVGWVCVAGMGYNFILYPFLKFMVVLVVPDAPALPVLESGELMTLLLGMLGLVGARTYEKGKGVAR